MAMAMVNLSRSRNSQASHLGKRASNDEEDGKCIKEPNGTCGVPKALVPSMHGKCEKC